MFTHICNICNLPEGETQTLGPANQAQRSLCSNYEFISLAKKIDIGISFDCSSGRPGSFHICDMCKIKLLSEALIKRFNAAIMLIE